MDDTLMEDAEQRLDDSPDMELARAACAGDERAFGELFRRLYGGVHRTVWGMLGEEQSAHDIVQEAWIKAWEKRATFNFTSHFSTWIHRIAINKALDELRRRKQFGYRMLALLKDGLPFASSPTSDQPDKDLLNKELGGKIEAAVAALPDDQRTILVLREYEGYSYQEIAEIVGCKTGTVMSRLHLARQKLQKSLRKD